MSVSLMKQLIVLAASALIALALVGCTSFAPVYGDMSAAGMPSARFNFAPPESRLEQVILNRLDIAFPGPANPGDPVLAITASSVSLDPAKTNVAAGNPVATRVEATATITQGTRVLFTATRFTDTAYQSDKLTPTDVLSASGAVETAARSTAESLRAAILAGYRPSIAPILPGG